MQPVYTFSRVRVWSAKNTQVVACGQVPVKPSSREDPAPVRKDISMAWLADSFRALIEKSMSICVSSSPGRLPARQKSPNEAWSRYLIPDSLSQSDFAVEVIHPSWTWGPSSTWVLQHVFVAVVVLDSVSGCTCRSVTFSDLVCFLCLFFHTNLLCYLLTTWYLLCSRQNKNTAERGAVLALQKMLQCLLMSCSCQFRVTVISSSWHLPEQRSCQ